MSPSPRQPRPKETLCARHLLELGKEANCRTSGPPQGGRCDRPDCDLPPIVTIEVARDVP